MSVSYSYSYDLTHTLQYNMSPSVNPDQSDNNQSEHCFMDFWRNSSEKKVPNYSEMTDASMELLDSENHLQEFCMNSSMSISPVFDQNATGLEKGKHKLFFICFGFLDHSVHHKVSYFRMGQNGEDPYTVDINYMLGIIYSCPIK